MHEASVEDTKGSFDGKQNPSELYTANLLWLILNWRDLTTLGTCKMVCINKQSCKNQFWQMMKLIIGKCNNLRGKFRLKYKQQITNVNHHQYSWQTSWEHHWKWSELWNLRKRCWNKTFNITVQSFFVLMSIGWSCIIALTTFPRQSIQLS